MKTIEITEATGPLSTFARQVANGPLVVTAKGKPVAVLMSTGGADLETVSVSLSPKFWEIMERSRASHEREGGYTPDEVRRELGLPRRASAAKSKVKRQHRKVGRVSAH